MTASQEKKHNFRVHWLDNKELQFTMEAERLLQEIHIKMAKEDQTSMYPKGESGLDEKEDSDEHDEMDNDANDADHGQETKDVKEGCAFWLLQFVSHLVLKV